MPGVRSVNVFFLQVVPYTDPSVPGVKCFFFVKNCSSVGSFSFSSCATLRRLALMGEKIESLLAFKDLGFSV